MMKRSPLRPLLGLLLTLALLMSLAVPALAWDTRETDFFSDFPQEVDFKTLTYGTPDLTKIESIIRDLTAAAQKAGNQEAVSALLNELEEESDHFVTAYAVFNVAYCNDPSALADEYSLWESAINRMNSLYTQAIQSLLASGSKDAVPQVLGEAATEYLGQAKVDTPEQLALLDQCSDLVSQYWTKIGADTPVTYKGAAYKNVDDAYAAYLNDTLSWEEFASINAEMEKATNALVGPIFVELVGLRNQYARSMGEESYTEYAYQVDFGRDYTPAETEAIHESVKKHIVPLNKLFATLPYLNEDIATGYAAVNELFTGITQEELLDMAEPYMGYVSSEYAELFAYMRRCNLIDVEPSPTKNNQGFTTGLPDYDSAIIFNKSNGTYFDLQTIVHEFGHFAQTCLAGDSEMGLSYDVAEIDSQGLELLYLPYVADMVGEEAAPTYRFEQLNGMVSNAVTMGCVHDEFLQRVYAEKDLTLDKVNRIYHDVGADYGLSFSDDTYAYDWVAVHHDFESPFYYISYCTSALAALEIMDMSLTDYDAACDAYLKLVNQGAGAENGFRQALETAGLSDVFEEKTIRNIADAVEDYLYGEICGVSFTDLDGNWAEDDARFCAALGLFSGAPDGSFQSAATLTRAQAVSLLWRIMGEPEARETSGVSDVSPNAWYAGAVNWAAKHIPLFPDVTESGLFAPEQNITRQELAFLLYGTAADPQVDTSVLDQFSDTDEISDWAKDAMAWCVGNSLLNGRSGGLLAPNAPLTRGEAASILANLFL